MSFDVYVEWYQNGEADWVPTGELRRAFGTALVGEDEFGWRLSFGPDLSSDVYLSFYGDDTSKVCGVAVNRPSSAPSMWSALFNLLGLGNSVFYFPGGGLFVRSPLSAQHLPRGMLEELGEPEVVRRPEDLAHAIESS